MHTEDHCLNLGDLNVTDAVRAIHQAYLQLSAMAENLDVTPYDPHPALASLRSCLQQAGHVGFSHRPDQPKET